MSRKVLSVKETAEMLDCAPTTIQRAVRAGKIHGIKLGPRKIVIPTAEVEGILNGDRVIEW